MGQSVFVAGGAGFIGSHLIDALLLAGHTVVCADNLCLGSRSMIERHLDNAGFTFYEADVCDAAKLGAIFLEHRFDRVYHLAANSDIQKGGQDPSIDIRDTLETTLALPSGKNRGPHSALRAARRTASSEECLARQPKAWILERSYWNFATSPFQPTAPPV